MSLAFYALLAALVAVAIYTLRNVGRRPANYPPGPPTLPIIGNLHLMPKEKPHLQFQKWAEEYGPVYSLILGTKVMVVLSSDQAVKDLLDKRSGIYSSRPDLYLSQIASGASEVSGGLRMLFMPYGDTWRMIRKIVHNALNIKVARAYVLYQDLENKAMLVGFLESPHLFIDHIRRYTNSLTTQMIFGFRTTSIDDPKLKQLYLGVEEISKVTGKTTATLLDLFPILRALPDCALPLRRYAKQIHKKQRELLIGHWLNVKKAIKNDTAKPCFCLDLVRAQDEENFSDALAAYISGSLLEAGSDTTAATLVGFVQALVLFPEVAQTAREELDRICGSRLPNLTDAEHLPYIRACVKESMRWMPTAILGVPHAVIRDDEYMGYTIPKNASVVFNVWGIHNNSTRHPEPRRFNPQRYFHDTQTAAEAANNPDASKRDHFLFGAGRRVCQGMHIAERSLFLAMSRLLWAFEFRPARDGGGDVVLPDVEDLTEGFLVHPRPFPADIVPRDEAKARVVREEWGKMGGLLDEELQWKVLPDGLIWKEYDNAAKVM